MFAEIKLYISCFLTILLVDLVWIGIVMKAFYIEQLRPIGRITDGKFEPSLWAAACVYAVLSIAVVQFALPRVSSETSWISTFGVGALLGFVIYACYDFTNYSTLKDWTLLMTFVDIVWGAVLLGMVTCVARLVREI